MSKHIYQDLRLLIGLLFISVVSVYFMPTFINRAIFILILLAAFRTKQDYVYLVWFFIINDAPGRLFSGSSYNALRIPLYTVTTGVSVGFQELFLLLYLYKYLNMRYRPDFIFRKEFSWFLAFGLLTVGWSLLLGMSFDNMVKTFRIFLPWSLIFILPTYIFNSRILLRSSLLLFPVVLLAFLSQIYTYITGNYLETHLRGLDSFYFGLDDGGFAIRTYSAIYITLFSVILALYYFFKRQSEINPNYLSLVIFFGVFSIFLSATRGWIIAMTLFLLGVLLYFGFSRDLVKWFRLAAVCVVVFLIVGTQFFPVQKQVDATLQRLTTIEALASGDVTAGGTLSRLNVRMPKVMDKFWQSPLVGWGFSDDFFAFADGHVGHPNILLNVGIGGYLFVNGLFIIICIKILNLFWKTAVQAVSGKAPMIYLFGLMAVYVIHSSSAQLWGYTLNLEKILFFGFLFSAINVSMGSLAAHEPSNIGLREKN